MTQKISIIVLTYKRDDALKNTLDRIQSSMGSVTPYELILIDNNSDGVGRGELVAGFENSTYVNVGFNSGVTWGRMRGISNAQGDIAIFIDDDALLEVGDNFSQDIIDEFSSSPELAVIAFRSFVGSSRYEDPKEFPHTNKAMDHDKPFDTFRFIGVAHALRVSHFNEVGGYCDSFFYGMEEFDLSYRFIKKGYRIKYQPNYCVQHMKQDDGRLPAKNVIQRMYANKLSVAWMHLPIVYFLICAAAWFVKTTKDARSPITAVKSIGDFLTMVSHGKLLPRNPSKKLAGIIQKLGGDAWR